MTTELSLANVQGDILVGFSKKVELFYFFQIDNADAFRAQLTNLVPLISPADKTIGEKAEIRKKKEEHRQNVDVGYGTVIKPVHFPVVGVNIAFSATGLQKLQFIDNPKLNDVIFDNGMKQDAKELGDNNANPGADFKPDWDPAFLQDIHGVVLIAGDSFDTTSKKLADVKASLSTNSVSSIIEVATLAGDVRPGENSGHEHFGYLDGISQPAIDGVDEKILPGQAKINQGVVLLGRKGDTGNSPPWALDGSILAFRKLPQKVPEFEKFLLESAKSSNIDIPDGANGADILGARLVGRWKSGAPVRLAPLADDPELGKDEQRNNKFKFSSNSQRSCPFAAHVRKMNPRGDLDAEIINERLILRRGIPFGPEVTSEEKITNKTQNERGLYFVSYQSNLANGFSFLQKSWANNEKFPVEKPFLSGFDPIIGQKVDQSPPREMIGANGDNVSSPMKLEAQWVNSKGGEYFFSPSIPTLKNVIAKPPVTIPPPANGYTYCPPEHQG
ncbi:Dyp-type peroxidase [Polyplosphaeria fusca]|uniref:Dyp-type peroxidase n=1 Tax=Polyplosphaeria fusca TaxID=682080 RepID=A0A9P4V5I4_9PLEO|nr:Dyp-type peroxidase [Polyplosphaeria fusca]